MATMATAPNKLWLPKLEKEIDRPWFLMDEAMVREQRRLLSSVYFLVRQGDAFGERLKCVKCGERHDYITLNCIERPFTGLIGGLYASFRVIGDNGLERTLRPEQRSRLRGVRKILNDMPDISKAHPQLARQMAKDLAPNDLQMGAVAIGLLEGIPATLAQRLADRINERYIRPPFRLAPPSMLDLERAKRWR